MYYVYVPSKPQFITKKHTNRVIITQSITYKIKNSTKYQKSVTLDRIEIEEAG